MKDADIARMRYLRRTLNVCSALLVLAMFMFAIACIFGNMPVVVVATALLLAIWSLGSLVQRALEPMLQGDRA